MGRSVLLHLLGCSFRLVQIPRRAHNLSAVGGQGAGRFHAKSGRNAGYENPFALQIHAGQNVICRSKLLQMKLPHVCSSFSISLY